MRHTDDVFVKYLQFIQDCHISQNGSHVIVEAIIAIISIKPHEAHWV